MNATETKPDRAVATPEPAGIVGALTEALEPFAKIADEIEALAARPDETLIRSRMKSCEWADLVRARDALRSSRSGEGAGELETYLIRQWDWSKETFGPALRTKGIVQHITKELREIEAKPHDLSEWVDVIILAMDGFWRHGGKPADLLPAMQAKQDKNFARAWPDWRTMAEDQAIEHDRSGEASPIPAPVTPLRGEREVIALAEKLYEASRKNVSGRPAWNKLDPKCPYDMGMKSKAFENARAALSARPDTAQDQGVEKAGDTENSEACADLIAKTVALAEKHGKNTAVITGNLAHWRIILAALRPRTADADPQAGEGK